MTLPRPDRDLSKLDPVFRERVEELLRRMHSANLDAQVWEAHRSFERAAALVKAGKHRAKALSMHCYGLAVDINSKAKLWEASPKFWTALRVHSEALGLTSGASFGDLDHVQALPTFCDKWVVNASAEEITKRVAIELDGTDPAKRATVRDSVRAKAKEP